MRNIFKNRLTNAGLLVAVCGSFLFYAFSAGSAGNTLKNGAGCTCHGTTAAPKVSVVINGSISLGQRKSETFTVTVSGGLLVRAGVNIAAKYGTLKANDSTLQVVSGELTSDTNLVAPTSGKVTYSFTYTAPDSISTDTLYAVGLSADFTKSSSGDSWAFATNKAISITPATGISKESAKANSFELIQNYPNPFNPSTLISYSLKNSEFVSLKVYDVAGNEVASLVNEMQSSGAHSLSFNASKLTSGVYVYKISTPSFSSSKKMVLTK